jgi:hypothetical protein
MVCVDATFTKITQQAHGSICCFLAAIGKGTVVYKNGDKYEGDWALGLRHGLGTLWVYRDGKYSVKYNGEWTGDAPTVSYICLLHSLAQIAWLLPHTSSAGYRPSLSLTTCPQQVLFQPPWRVQHCACHLASLRAKRCKSNQATPTLRAACITINQLSTHG